MLKKAIDYLPQKHAYTLIGDIKGNNRASKKIFDQLNFTETNHPTEKDAKRFQLQFNPVMQ